MASRKPARVARQDAPGATISPTTPTAADAPPVVLIESVRGESDRTARLVATPAGVTRIRQLAANGLSNTSIAGVLGIDRGTLAELAKRQPEIELALATGRGDLELELTDLLLKAARGGNWVSALALGKTRLGWREGEGVVINAPAVNVAMIELPRALTPEEYERMLTESCLKCYAKVQRGQFCSGCGADLEKQRRPASEAIDVEAIDVGEGAGRYPTRGLPEPPREVAPPPVHNEADTALDRLAAAPPRTGIYQPSRNVGKVARVSAWDRDRGGDE